MVLVIIVWLVTCGCSGTACFGLLLGCRAGVGLGWVGGVVCWFRCVALWLWWFATVVVPLLVCGVVVFGLADLGWVVCAVLEGVVCWSCCGCVFVF